MNRNGSASRGRRNRGWLPSILLVIAALVASATISVGPAGGVQPPAGLQVIPPAPEPGVASRGEKAVSWDPDSGNWTVRRDDGSIETTRWGRRGDTPLTGDIDGDGVNDYVAWGPRPVVEGRRVVTKWFFMGFNERGEVLPNAQGDLGARPKRTDDEGSLNLEWGTAGDVPFLGDLDGDGRDDMIIWRPSNGGWYARSSATFELLLNQQWGRSTDVPLVGDLDGDGADDLILWRPKVGGSATANGRFYARSLDWTTIFSREWGAGRLGDVPLIGDVDGNGADDVVIYRPSTGRWYPKSFDGSRPVSSLRHGGVGDLPMLFDADGDGADDAVIVRTRSNRNKWYAKTIDGRRLRLYGAELGGDDDVPLAGNFRPWTVEPLFSGTNVYAPTLMADGGLFKMWYGGWETDTEHNTDSIYYRTSVDRKHWTSPSPTSPTSPFAVISPDDLGIEASLVNDPTVTKHRIPGAPGWQYTMFFTVCVGEECRRDQDTAIWSAVSPDGINWSGHKPLIQEDHFCMVEPWHREEPYVVQVPSGRVCSRQDVLCHAYSEPSCAPGEPFAIYDPKPDGTVWDVYFMDRLNATNIKVVGVDANREVVTGRRTVFEAPKLEAGHNDLTDQATISGPEVHRIDGKWNLFFNIHRPAVEHIDEHTGVRTFPQRYRIDIDKTESNDRYSFTADSETVVANNGDKFCAALTPGVLRTGASEYELYFGVTPRTADGRPVDDNKTDDEKCYPYPSVRVEKWTWRG